jgi:23S rRNA pseudouridine2605 synthase
LTAEQLEAARAERMRQNGANSLVIDEARTWVEETGLCHYLPKKNATPSVAPSFIEAVAGRETPSPDNKLLQLSEDLLVRLELSDVAVRLNLQGQHSLVPDYAVATWVLPYVYALRGDRDWRRTPQLTGSRQVSPLAIQAYKLLEQGDATIPQLRTALGREVTEAAVLRAITELWQQLRIIPVTPAPGATPKWQLLRHRFQKAIAEGASTSQVTAISVLASIYLQAVIAASMEEVEMFLAPLTSRSKVREVMRGLVATRQVNTTNVGNASYFYVAGTLPEFPAVPSVYASSSISTYNYGGYRGREEDLHIAASADAGFGRSHAGSRPAFGNASSNGNSSTNGHASSNGHANSNGHARTNGNSNSSGHSNPDHLNGDHSAAASKPHSERKPAERNGSWKSNGASSRSSDSRSRNGASSSSRSGTSSSRNGTSRPSSSRPSSSRNGSSRPGTSRPSTSRSATSRTGSASRSSSARPASRGSASARPATSRTSSSHPASKRPVVGKSSAGRSTSARPAAKRPTSTARPARKPIAKGGVKRFTPTRKPAGKSAGKRK